MSWPSHIERLRQWASWECRDIPVDLVLAMVDQESNGQIGIIGKVKIKDVAQLPLENGGVSKPINHALGLMQIIPSHVLSWNQSKTPIIYYDDMIGKDERAARLQMRIGCSYYANLVNRLHSFDAKAFPSKSPGNASSEQLKLALVAYRMGPGREGGKRGLIPRLEQLKAQKLPLTLIQLKRSFPNWGYSQKKERWINKPFYYTQKIWQMYLKNQVIDQTEKQPGTLPKNEKDKDEKKKKDIGFLLPIGMFLVAQYMRGTGFTLFGKQKDNDEDS